MTAPKRLSEKSKNEPKNGPKLRKNGNPKNWKMGEKMVQNGAKTAIRKIGKWAKKWSKMARKRQSEKLENGLKMVRNGAKTAIRKIGKWAKNGPKW